MIADSLITAISNADQDVVLSQTGQLAMNILASAVAKQARIEQGVRNSDTSFLLPPLAPRLLPAGDCYRIRPPRASNFGGRRNGWNTQ